ncbi:MAG: hypothetical protein GX039_04730 [Clostridia bacterium]|nr:hypothetical protein [Clostridia bacterium]
MYKKVLFAVGLILAVMLLLSWGGLKTAGRFMESEDENGAGQVVPAFELPDQDGNPVRVPEAIKGRAIYMVFFSTG